MAARLREELADRLHPVRMVAEQVVHELAGLLVVVEEVREAQGLDIPQIIAALPFEYFSLSVGRSCAHNWARVVVVVDASLH